MSSTSDADALAAGLALRLGDSALVLGQRLCGVLGTSHELEEDLAQANIGLDLLGQARAWLTLAGRLDGSGRSEDEFAYGRGDREFRNATLVEQPNGHFGHVTCRQFLFDAWHVNLLDGLRASKDDRLADIAATAHREAGYHLRHSKAWFVRLADGTAESRARVEEALAALWPLCGELLSVDDDDRRRARAGQAPDLEEVGRRWWQVVGETFAEAGMAVPAADRFLAGLDGRQGIHTEHLGELLAVMQSVVRAHPGARW